MRYAMTVKELIEELKEFDQDLPVYRFERGEFPAQEVLQVGKIPIGESEAILIS